MSALLLALLWAVGAWPAFSQTSPIYAWTNFVGQPWTYHLGPPVGRGNADGAGSAVRFYGPTGVALDNAGNVFVADSNNHTIRRVTTAGVVSTLAGSAGASGTNDGMGSTARFHVPRGVAADTAGNVFVADQDNCTIRKVTPAGEVTTLAGSMGNPGSVDGAGSAARFNYTYGVAVDNVGNVFATDFLNRTIRKVTPAGVVTTLAGSAGQVGSVDGTGSAARFNNLTSVAVDSAGNVFVADYVNNTIRKVTPTGVVTTLAGSAGQVGSADGTGSAALFDHPRGVAVDGAGNVYVADSGNYTIRKVSPAGVVTTIGGTPGVPGAPGKTDGIGSSARFAGPSGIAVDRAGNLYVADDFNNCVIKGTPVRP
jgi:hypothetical protein